VLLGNWNVSVREAVRCEAVRCEAVRCEDVRCEDVRCEDVRCEAVRCEAVRCEAVPCCGKLCWRCVPRLYAEREAVLRVAVGNILSQFVPLPVMLHVFALFDVTSVNFVQSCCGLHGPGIESRC
jgi:hypothetical protein